MQVSQAMGLHKTQPELDFVDIELLTDTPLFLDPAAFYEGEGLFAENCSRDIEQFFEAVLHAAGTEDWDLGLKLLRGLSEPDEIQMGFSAGTPQGRGVGEKLAEQIFEAILRSKAVKSGLIRDLNDALIFVPGIGPDKVSDITTNIIRRHLIEYTQNQFALYDVSISSLMPLGFCGILLTPNGRRDTITSQCSEVERFSLFPNATSNTPKTLVGRGSDITTGL